MSHKDEKVIEIPSKGPASGIGSIPQSVRARLGDVETLTKAVLWVGLAALAAVVVTASALVLDQMHFNNQTYRDQSDKTNLQMQELNLQIEALKQELDAQKRAAPPAPDIQKPQ